MFLCLFRTLSKGGKLTMCNYLFITMVELQVHFSRTNRLLLDIHPLGKLRLNFVPVVTKSFASFCPSRLFPSF